MSEGKAHYRSLCARCYLLKVTGILLVLAIICFFAEEYVTLGMWDARDYMEQTTCSELIYNFPPSKSSASILDDVNLMTSCGVYGPPIENTTILTKYVNASSDIPLVKTKCGFQPGLLVSKHRTPPRNTSSDKIVPNIVHYISFGKWKFSFLNYMSFRSVSLFIKPDYIFVHGDNLPLGDWWRRTAEEIPDIYLVNRDKPTRVQGRAVRWIEHSSDVIRLQTILDNGGIYLDTDIIVLKSFDPLRRYEVTLGRESWYGLGSGIIVAAPRAPFICVWLSVFREYNPFPWNWAYYAVHTPHRLAKVLPDRVHVEESALQRPSWNEAHLLFADTVDWSQKFAIHVWKRYGPVPSSPDGLGNINSTLGQVLRYVYNYRQ